MTAIDGNMVSTSEPTFLIDIPAVYLPGGSASQRSTCELLPNTRSRCWSTAPKDSIPSWFWESKSPQRSSKDSEGLKRRVKPRSFSLSLPSFSSKRRGKALERDSKPSKSMSTQAKKENDGARNSEREEDTEGTNTQTRRRSSLSKIKRFFSSIRRDSGTAIDNEKSTPPSQQQERLLYNPSLEPLARDGLLRWVPPPSIPATPVSSDNGNQTVATYQEPTAQACSSTYWQNASYYDRPCTVVSPSHSSIASMRTDASDAAH